jgi:hypothetical protein
MLILIFHHPEVFSSSQTNSGEYREDLSSIDITTLSSQGYGSRMMQAVYQLAHNRYKTEDGDNNCDDDPSIPQTIVQVNVEDPAPAIVALTDYLFVEEYGHESGVSKLWQQMVATTVNSMS